MDRDRKHPRWNRPYTELAYQPMLEVLKYLRANGYRTYIVTGGGQDFVRVYPKRSMASRPSRWSARGRDEVRLRQGRQADPDQGAEAPAERQRCGQARGHPPDDRAPAARGVRQLDRRPADARVHGAGDGPRLSMLVLHDDAKREYAYGPAQGLPDTKVGTFTQALYDEARRRAGRDQHEERLEAHLHLRDEKPTAMTLLSMRSRFKRWSPSGVAVGLWAPGACARRRRQRRSRTSWSSGATTSASTTSAPTTSGGMGYKTPSIDRIAKEGALYTDFYAQQSCTAGRASFILGQHPFRTGLLTIGMPGSPQGIPDWSPTIADLLKAQGYTTGQFGKNHLGDRDQHLPTVHGFDEFLGNLYHLNAEEEPKTVLLSEGYRLEEELRAPRGCCMHGATGRAARRSRTPARSPGSG